jgi:hypothetical protein
MLWANQQRQGRCGGLFPASVVDVGGVVTAMADLLRLRR